MARKEKVKEIEIAGENHQKGEIEEIESDEEKEAQKEEQKEESREEDKIKELEKKIEELEKENSELKDMYLRKQADFENFRKRMFREKEEAIRYANSRLLEDLIPIIDDFERAINSAEDSKDFESFYKGIELIEKQFTSMLERKWGLKRFESTGEVFDPEMHEAINTEEREDNENSIVLEDYQKGYKLHDRVLRHAKVKVSVPVKKGSSSNNINENVNGGEE